MHILILLLLLCILMVLLDISLLFVAAGILLVSMFVGGCVGLYKYLGGC